MLLTGDARDRTGVSADAAAGIAEHVELSAAVAPETEEEEREVSAAGLGVPYDGDPIGDGPGLIDHEEPARGFVLVGLPRVVAEDVAARERRDRAAPIDEPADDGFAVDSVVRSGVVVFGNRIR